jgi:zinc protease
MSEAALDFRLPAAHRRLSSGVPTIHLESDAATYEAFLSFRVGRADETLPQAGITHLVEHLAFAPDSTDITRANGWVGDTTTTFAAMGTEDEVRDFLTRISAGLASPAVARLEHEKRIMLTEEASQGMFPPWASLPLRFGATGWGTLGFEQFALHGATEEDVSAWANRWFCRENAVLCTTGPAPFDVDLAVLPQGSAAEWPQARRISGLELPSFAPLDNRHVVFSMECRDIPEIGTTMRLLRTQTEQHLRHELGLSYAISVHWLRTGRGTAIAFLWADCLYEHAAAVTQGMWQVLQRIADFGPTAEELRRELTVNRRFYDDPDAARHLLPVYSADALQGLTIRQTEVELEQILSVSGEAVASLAGELRRTLLVTAPTTQPPDEDAFHEYPWLADAALPGKRVRGRGPASGSDLILGDEGVAVRLPDGKGVNARWTDCEAVLRWQNGDVMLITRDADRVAATTRRHRNVEEVSAAAARAIDERRFVDMPGDECTWGQPTADVRTAPLRERLTAAFVDGWALFALFVGCVLAVTIPAQALGAEPDGADRDQLLLATELLWAVVAWLYFAVSESSPWSASPGKRARGLVVVTESGERMSFLRANARLATAVVGLVIVGVGFLPIPFSRRRHGLHDMLTGTEVMQRTGR